MFSLFRKFSLFDQFRTTSGESLDPVGPGVTDNLLLESGDALLLESGDLIILETA